MGLVVKVKLVRTSRGTRKIRATAFDAASGVVAPKLATVLIQCDRNMTHDENLLAGLRALMRCGYFGFSNNWVEHAVRTDAVWTKVPMPGGSVLFIPEAEIKEKFTLATNKPATQPATQEDIPGYDCNPGLIRAARSARELYKRIRGQLKPDEQEPYTQDELDRLKRGEKISHF